MTALFVLSCIGVIAGMQVHSLACAHNHAPTRVLCVKVGNGVAHDAEILHLIETTADLELITAQRQGCNRRHDCANKINMLVMQSLQCIALDIRDCVGYSVIWRSDASLMQRAKRLRKSPAAYNQPHFQAT